MKNILGFSEFINESSNITFNVGDIVTHKSANTGNYVILDVKQGKIKAKNLNTGRVFNDLINPHEFELVNESGLISESEADYIYKEDSGGGKPTWTLRLTRSGWDKVKHLFDAEGRPTKELTRIPAEGSVWNLYAQTYPAGHSQAMYKIYGVSGDWTFGNAPTFYQQKHRGNKKAAKKVYDWFIQKYLA